MAEDWAVDVKKYVPDADDAVIAGIVRHCGIALKSRDAALVAFSDSSETDRVRESFLKKKLNLTQSDESLDKAIAAVGARMKADRTKNRVTVYYLLAEHFGQLDLFKKVPKAAKPKGAAPQAEAAPVMAESTVSAANMTEAPESETPHKIEPLVGQAPASGTARADESMRGLLWLILGLLALGLLMWLLGRHPKA